jgi:hypothetical protein
MNVDEIKDRKSLEAWLTARPGATRRSDSIIIAHRAALRVLPLWAGAMGQAWAQNAGLTALPLLRASLTSGVAHKNRTAEVKQAAAAAAAAAGVATAFATEAATTVTTKGTIAAADAATDAAYAATASTDAAHAASSDAANAATAAAAGSASVASATAVTARVVWAEMRADAYKITEGADPATFPLWTNPPVDWFRSGGTTMRAIWASDPGTWSFWLRWWDGVLAGRPLPDDLQLKVALIPEETWKAGPAAVAEAIRAFEQDGDAFAQDLRAMPPAPPAVIQAVRSAMERNRQSLPPTFDAIEGLLLLEVERLQQSNDRDAAWERQMRVYLSLYDAVTGLRATLPLSGPITDVQAEKSEKLLRLYADKFAELPVAKVDEVVEGTWEMGKGIVKAGLIGTTALLGMSYGLPVIAGIALGSMIFAPKSAGELIKAAREAVTKP